MLDEQSASYRRIVRIVKFSVIAAAAMIVGWYALQFRPPRRTPTKTTSQQVAILRDHDASYMVRLVAAEAIDRADGSVVGELTAELSEGDAFGRELAALALGRLNINDAPAVDALIQALDGPEQEVRQRAALALRRTGARKVEVAAALGRIAGDTNPEVRRWAVIELGRVDRDDASVLGVLRDRLHDSDARVRAESYAALARHSALTVDDLILVLHDADRTVRRTAYILLGRMGAQAEPAIPELIEQLTSQDAFVWDAQEALRIIGKQAPQIADFLTPLLDSENERAAERAALLIGSFGNASETVRQELLDHLEDPRADVANYAFQSLYRTGLESQLRPPDLTAALAERGEALSLVLHEIRRGRNRGMPSSYPTDERGYDVTDQDLAKLADLKKLRLLDLGANPVGDAGLEQIAGLENLEWLILCDTKITSAGLVHLGRLSRLRTLSLAGCDIADEGLDLLQGLTALEALDLRSTRVTNAGMQRLAALKRLKAVWLDDTEVTDEGLKHLAELPLLEDLGYETEQFTLRGLAQLKGLISVRPRPESVSDDDLALLAELPRLRRLNLSGSGITDAGLTHFAKLTQLESLSLNETSISDVGLEQLKTLVNLKSLGVYKTRTTEAGLEALDQALPKLESRLVPAKPQSMAANQYYEVVGLKADDERDAAPSVP